MSGTMETETRFSFDALDYFRIRDELCIRLQSDITAQLVDDMVPLTDDAEIDHLLEITDESRRYLDRERAGPVLAQMDDLRPSTARASKGGLLDTFEILAVARTARLLRVASNSILNSEREYPTLKSIASQIETFIPLEENISRCIHPEGSVLDSASPGLRKIRKALEAARKDIEERLRRLLQTYGRKGYLRENNFTMRNGRYVLPFRSEHLREIKLVIQSTSETKQTFFVEPLEMVDKNNQLQHLLGEEAAEIERILYELTGEIASNAGDLVRSLETGRRLDFIFAKGRLSKDWDGAGAANSQEISIKGMRHPFIKGKVIPVDIIIAGKRGLIITGPNAGGKTVALKSIGLCALLNQSGLHIPAKPGSSIPRFGAAMAEIGDRQNIDLSLSSFSAHIEFLKGMTGVIESGEPHHPSLVLLDEIGRSTDPQEGSALALAVIEFLLAHHVYFAITTHLPALKNLVLERSADLASASVEFDIDKVEPLYQLKLDSLGASYAVLMSERFGLDKRLVQRAREIIGESTGLLEVDIALLQSRRDILQKQVQNLEADVAAINEERAKLIALERIVLTDILSGVESAFMAAREIVAGAEKQRESILKETAGAVERDVETRKLDEKLIRLRRMRNILEIPQPVQAAVSGGHVSHVELKEGDRVWLIDLKKEGRVIEEGRRGKYKIAVDALKMTVDESGIRKMDDIIERKPPSGKGTTVVPQVLTYIDLHGDRVEEGLRKVDEYLDSAYFARQREVRIIHGIGTGQLRRAVRDHLKKHDLVESYRTGTPEEGGSGATIVRFKD